eukprot:1115492-Prorocentrum_minimum.AAC.2
MGKARASSSWAAGSARSLGWYGEDMFPRRSFVLYSGGIGALRAQVDALWDTDKGRGHFHAGLG